jgi:hypothetical protein
MRRPVTLLLSALFAFALLATGPLRPASVSAVTQIAPTTLCGNGILNAGGQGLICQVTVANTITPTGGSATVTVNECQGSAAVPAPCILTTNVLTAPVTRVEQCNGSISGGGGTLRCNVTITNNFVGFSTSPTVSAVSVHQCVGSVTTGTVRVCLPDPATVDGASIVQCDGSGNGGGATLTCSATGTESSGLVVTINQCNGSSNGGGTLTECVATMANNIVAATPTATPAPGATASPAPGATAGPTAAPTARPTARPTAPPTNTGQLVPAGSTTDLVFLPLVALLVALSLVLVLRRRTS